MRFATAVVMVLFLVPVLTIAADFDGDSRDDIAVFRPSSGLWVVRGITRVYFGTSSDEPMTGDFTGDGVSDIGIFRASSGLWSIRNVTRVYFGGPSDEPLAGGGGGQRLYDYVVKAGDAGDLVAALESDTYLSVFIPSGTYNVAETINIDHVRQVVGEDPYDTLIQFPDGINYYISVENDYSHLENIRTNRGGYSNPNYWGVFHITGSYVSLSNCRSDNSLAVGFDYSGIYTSFVNCIVHNAAHTGFIGPSTPEVTSRLVSCAARLCEFMGFSNCYNLSSCYVYGGGTTANGFRDCYNLSSCAAVACDTSGFNQCRSLSSCTVLGSGDSDNGFYDCDNLAACHVEGTTGGEYVICTHYSTDTNGSCD